MVEPLAGALSSLRGQILADKRKFAVLGGLLLVLTVVVGRLLLSGAAPASVEGALLVPDSPALKTTRVIPEPPRPAPAATPTRETLRSGPRRGGGPDVQGGKRPHGDVAALPKVLSRDLFTASDWSVFPRVARRDSATPRPDFMSSIGVWSRLGSALTGRAEARQRLSDEVEQAFESLELQATMTGPTPRAYISGRLVRAGDRVAGFIVVRVSDRRVELRRGGETRALTMP